MTAARRGGQDENPANRERWPSDRREDQGDKRRRNAGAHKQWTIEGTLDETV
jgi:hypothetical protein